MPKPHIPQPQNIRKIAGSFAWIDHRLLRNGYLQALTHQDIVLYVFLVLAADKHGVSFYRKEKICDLMALDFQQFEVARDRLTNEKLIAFERYCAFSPNGFYQVLAIRQTRHQSRPGTTGTVCITSWCSTVIPWWSSIPSRPPDRPNG